MHATEGAVASRGTDLMNPTCLHIPTVAVGPFPKRRDRGQEIISKDPGLAVT